MNRKEHLERIMEALDRERMQNNTQVIEEPANDFERAVNDWEEQQALHTVLKDLLKPLAEDEREARNGIADSLRAFFGDDLKEGMNTYKLSNQRKLKFSHKIERKIDTPSVVAARAEYEKADDAPAGQTFDDILRVKYELSATPFKKVSGNAALALSRMIVSKVQSPEIKVD